MSFAPTPPNIDLRYVPIAPSLIDSSYLLGNQKYLGVYTTYRFTLAQLADYLGTGIGGNNIANHDLVWTGDRNDSLMKHSMLWYGLKNWQTYDTSGNSLMNLGGSAISGGMLYANGYANTAKLSTKEGFCQLNVNLSGFALHYGSYVLQASPGVIYMDMAGRNIFNGDSIHNTITIARSGIDTTHIGPTTGAGGYNLPFGTPAADAFIVCHANGNWDYLPFPRFVTIVSLASRKTGVTGATSFTAYSVGAVDTTFMVSFNVNITTATSFTFHVQCAYTDETGTPRTLILPYTPISGVPSSTSMTDGDGAVPYHGSALQIRAKASTTITISTVGTFTTVVYNFEERIVKG